MQNPSSKSKAILILILGCMTALSPFSIDMYLPAFQNIAIDFHTTVARISFSLASYFVGLSFGQLFYGPLLDRFGRKRPLYVGLTIYIVASVFCVYAASTESLVIWRFLQALGGCAVGVGSMAMVRDLFTVKESAKVYSTLILILGASPLLAPTIGGYVAQAWGWRSVFTILAVMAATLLAVIKFFLNESHRPDPSVILRAKPIAKGYLEIFRNTQFSTYVISGAVAFSGLFVYLAGSPVIFLETYKLGKEEYGWIFAIIAAGMIISSQTNVMLLRRFANEKILIGAMTCQVVVGLLLSLGAYFDGLNLYSLVFFLFLFMCTFGLTNPNAGALALAPFTKNAGSAAALMGFLQMGLGALASMSIGALGVKSIFPIVTIMAGTSLLALVILFLGMQNIRRLKLPQPME